MIREFQSPTFLLRLVRATSLLVPEEFRSEWRREWEAEVINRWLLLEKWGRLDRHSKLDLLKRVQGALRDAICFQQRRTRLLLVTLNMLVAALTAFGALQELIVSGILYRQMQPFLLSLAGMIVSVLFMRSGIAMLRQWLTARRLVIATGTFSVLLHVYGALPPHRTMGYVALLVGAGYGLVMLLAFEWNRRRNLVS
jgi:hypothetical protein